MADRLGLLMATESEDLAARVGRALAEAGLSPAYGLAATPRALARALSEEPWDLVVCDMDLPGLPWREALDMVRVSDCDAPFLLLASDMSPDEAARAAMECVAAGAHDLLLDGDWRTPAVVARVLREARGLREMARVERDLRQAERRYRDMLDTDAGNLPLHVLLARAKREWERTFDSVQDPIVIFDADLRVRRMNLALAERLGMHPREAVGRTCMAVLDIPGHAPEVCGRILSMADGGTYAEELSIPALGGEFLVTVSPLFMDESVPAGTVLVAHDVTRRKDLEARLRQAQKMEAIGTLAGGIAHDFNNILGVIMGYAEMALDSAVTQATGPLAEANGALVRRLEEILKAGRRARDLIHQILTFSRHDRGQLAPMRLGPVIKEVAKMVEGSLPPGVTVRLDLAAANDATTANLTQLHQVLMNLCANAAQAMEGRTGEVGITLREADVDGPRAEGLRLPPGPYLRLTVSDQGPGVDPAIMDNIFDPFFTTKPPGQGTGMGLALVHGIVRGHGGTVTVDSEPGRGASFHVLLPAAGPEAHGRDAGAALEPPEPRGRGRILVVDDEEALAAITAESLAAMGFEARAETDPRAALERFRNDPGAFDAALVDLVMPALPGPELIERLLALRPDLAVAACTGFAQSEAVEAVRALGVDEVLHKPVARAELARAMARLLAGRALP